MKLDFSKLHLLFFECLHVLACLSITTLTKLKRMHRLEIISENALVIAIWLVLASIQCFSRFFARSIDCWFHMHLCWWSSVFKSLHKIVYTDCHFIITIISVRDISITYYSMRMDNKSFQKLLFERTVLRTIRYMTTQLDTY